MVDKKLRRRIEKKLQLNPDSFVNAVQGVLDSQPVDNAADQLKQAINDLETRVTDARTAAADKTTSYLNYQEQLTDQKLTLEGKQRESGDKVLEARVDSLESRRVVAERIGSFFLLLVSAGAVFGMFQWRDAQNQLQASRDALTTMKDSIAESKKQQQFMFSSATNNRETALLRVTESLVEILHSMSSAISDHEQRRWFRILHHNEVILERMTKSIGDWSLLDQPDDSSDDDPDESRSFEKKLVRELKNTEDDVKAIKDMNTGVLRLVTVSAARRDAKNLVTLFDEADDVWQRLDNLKDPIKERLQDRGVNIGAHCQYAFGLVQVHRHLKQQKTLAQISQAKKHLTSAIKADSTFGRAYGMYAFALGREVAFRTNASNATSLTEQERKDLFRQRMENVNLALSHEAYPRARSVGFNNRATIQVERAEYLHKNPDPNSPSERIEELLDGALRDIRLATGIQDSHPVTYLTHAQILCVREALLNKKPDDPSREQRREKIRESVLTLIERCRANGYEWGVVGSVTTWNQFIGRYDFFKTLDDSTVFKMLDDSSGTFYDRLKLAADLEN